MMVIHSRSTGRRRRITTAMVGDIEVSVPDDILDGEMQRAPGDTDEELAAAAAAYRAMFAAALGR